MFKPCRSYFCQNESDIFQNSKMAAMSKEEYLKKYLSADLTVEKKKKKKKKEKIKTIQPRL